MQLGKNNSEMSNPYANSEPEHKAEEIVQAIESQAKQPSKVDFDQFCQGQGLLLFNDNNEEDSGEDDSALEHEQASNQ